MVGAAPFPSVVVRGRREATRGDRRCGDVLEEKKKNTKIYMGEMNFFFLIEPSAMHQRVFLSLYFKRLLRKKFYFCCNVLAALGTLKEPGLPRPSRG